MRRWSAGLVAYGPGRAVGIPHQAAAEPIAAALAGPEIVVGTR
ncbi:hypothetical protein [Nonomuraea helvata]|uniref:Uncharacterized protein n=1 Tax=Nonomuraea helvata TaxID=37484 RepID=A0ABV5S175_9ACTN